MEKKPIPRKTLKQEKHPRPVDVISTGSLRLDIALGIGGIPSGEIIEIYGPESAGKTTLCLHIIAQAQKRGGVCALIDADHSLDLNYAKLCGVNLEQLYISEPENEEKVLEIAETLCSSRGLSVLVVDSVSALIPKSELQAKLGDTYQDQRNQLLSLSLRKLSTSIQATQTAIIFTNQATPQGISAVYHSLGANIARLALKLYASILLDMENIRPIREKGIIAGNCSRVRVVKNRFGLCFPSIELDIMYNEGIRKTGDILELGFESALITRTGSIYSFRGLRLGNGSEEVIGFLRQNPLIAEEIEREIRLHYLTQ